MTRQRIHDGDTFLLRGGDRPLFAEFLDTDGRIGLRVSDRLGNGILLEGDCMGALSILLDTILDKPAPDLFEYFST